MEKKNAKITKRSHADKSYTSTYIVKILNSFNPELQLKDTEYAIRNKLIDLLAELKSFKFVTTLILEFLKIESEENRDKIMYTMNNEQCCIQVNNEKQKT